MPAKSTFGSASVIPYSSSSSSYKIPSSLRFNAGDTAYLNRTLSTPTNNKIFTYSCWVKSTGSTARQPIFIAIDGGSTNFFGIEFAVTTQTLLLWDSNYSFSAPALTTSQVFRDPSAWYHIVMSIDTTQATAANRTKLYVNGSQITDFSSANYAAENSSPYMNSAVSHSIGSWLPGVALYASLYMTELNFIDGQALTPSSFGETDAITGSWKAKAYAGTYGTNGFYLKFADNSNNTATTLGKDSSPNGNNWTPNNFSVATTTLADKVANDSLVDSPTNYGEDTGLGGEVRGNYATLNPISTLRGTIIDGALRTNGGDRGSISTIGMTSGKWFCEMYVTALGFESSVGISRGINIMISYVGSTTDSWGYYYNGLKYNNASSASYGSSYTTGDTIGVSFDASAGTLVFYKNGVSQGTAYSSLTSGPYYFAVEGRSSTSANDVTMNFGQQPWKYAPPAGFKALCTTNLPIPPIKKSSTGFDAITYNGTGTTFVSPSGLKFAPDLVWVKSRSQNISHVLSDTVRGVGEVLCTNNSRLSSSDSFITNFNQNGFTLNNSVSANNSGSTYVAWCWKAGGQTQTNTVGSITSQVNADPSRGFSVVSYTGTGANATVGHGLTTSPKFLIVKSRQTNGRSWNVWHTALAGTEYLLLETSDAKATDATKWNSTIPTASVFSLGTGAGTNASAEKYIAYCWSEVDGYSKFGSYTGNGSTDGAFVYTGFRPKLVLVKNTTGDTWVIKDTSRSIFNGTDYELYPSSAVVEGTYSAPPIMDYLSNGFKLRSTASASNGAASIIFAAFAEAPFKYARAR